MFSTRQEHILHILDIDLANLLKLTKAEQERLIQEAYDVYLSKQNQFCTANTYPTIEVKNSTSTVEHEATTNQINKEILEYLQSRGLSEDEAIALVISGYCKDVLQNLPFEFAVEARNLLKMKVEGF
jgi:Fe-S cluster assembly protein SufB